LQRAGNISKKDESEQQVGNNTETVRANTLEQYTHHSYLSSEKPWRVEITK